MKQQPPLFDGSVPPPDFVSIETTRFCNLRCRMCFQFNDGSTVAGPHMDMAEFRSVAEAVFPFVRRWQPSVSGEATMTRDFDQMLALGERFGVKAEMVTNATLLDEDMISQLAPSVALVMFSFDAAQGETFETIREGSHFDRVCENIRQFVRYCQETLPRELWPQFGFNCTLMERNVREFPAVVRLAAEDLGVDFVNGYHVFPPIEVIKPQSLVHHRDLAIRCFDEAFRVAEEVGMPLAIHGLDHATATAATDGQLDGIPFDDTGMVQGLGYRETLQETRRALPLLDERHPDYEALNQRRAEAGQRYDFPAPASPGDPEAAETGEPLPDSIQWCDFLWNKSYVFIGGNVRPCCVAQAPVVGNHLAEGFDKLWNNENYRTMRRRLVLKDPVSACRGCLHVREVEDPARIRELLGGRRVPRLEDEPPIPAALKPEETTGPVRRGPPPTLTWEAVEGARSYVVEFSLDRHSVLFTTDSAQSPTVHRNSYEIPIWAWQQAPVDREIYYTVIARFGDRSEEITQGSIPAES